MTILKLTKKPKKLLTRDLTIKECARRTGKRLIDIGYNMKRVEELLLFNYENRIRDFPDLLKELEEYKKQTR